MTSTKTNPGNFFEDFRFGQVIAHATPRTVTVGDVALYTSLYGTRFAVQSSDAFAKAIGYPHGAARRPADLPHGVRQDDAGHLAQRHRQPRLRQLPLPEAGLSRRHAGLDLRGDRPQGELQPRDRRRLRALDGAQPARRGGARVRALGDGAEARQGRSDARGGRAEPAAARRSRGSGRGGAGARTSAATTSRSPARPIAGATTRWARRSTTSTA